jgi:hypothetical protein
MVVVRPEALVGRCYSMLTGYQIRGSPRCEKMIARRCHQEGCAELTRVLRQGVDRHLILWRAIAPGLRLIIGIPRIVAFAYRAGILAEYLRRSWVWG